MIGLLGSTGYIGRLVAAELACRGVSHRLDPHPFDTGLEEVDVVINTVKPFRESGLAVVHAAVDSGVTYVDSSADPGFLSLVYERFGCAPALLVPGCGFDYLIGDLAAAIAVADLSAAAVDEVSVAYDRDGTVPHRARLSRLPRRRRIQFPDGDRSGIEIQWGERITIPRWLPGAQVTTVVAVNDVAATVLQVSAVLDPLSRFLQTGRAGSIPRAASVRVMAEARGDRRRAAVLVEVRDVSRLTARLLVEAALQAGGAGALTPAQALDPEPFLRSVAGDGLTWQRVA